MLVSMAETWDRLARQRETLVARKSRLALIEGGKAIISEIGPAAIPAPRSEDARLKALAKAFRWRAQIESGEYASITDLAKARGVNDSYACRLLRLTLLSPEIVTTILDRRQSPDFTLKELTRPLPIEWDQQLTAINNSYPK